MALPPGPWPPGYRGHWCNLSGCVWALWLCGLGLGRGWGVEVGGAGQPLCWRSAGCCSADRLQSRTQWGSAGLSPGAAPRATATAEGGAGHTALTRWPRSDPVRVIPGDRRTDEQDECGWPGDPVILPGNIYWGNEGGWGAGKTAFSGFLPCSPSSGEIGSATPTRG